LAIGHVKNPKSKVRNPKQIPNDKKPNFKRFALVNYFSMAKRLVFVV